MNKTLILLLTILIFTSCDVKTKALKSEIQTHNDTIVGVKKYDKKGKLIFNKTTQIIEDWNNDLMSWITADFYSDGKKTYSYYLKKQT